MFEENENLVEEETTEKAEEQTAEEIVEDNGEVNEETTEEDKEEVEEEPTEQEKVYTEEEFNQKLDDLLAKKLARKEAKMRREYERKYGEAESLLKAGLEKDTFEDAVSELKNFYAEKGVQIPKYEPSPREAEILADAEAREIIESGYDDIVEEVDRLAKIGVDNMTPREKRLFSNLAKERKDIEDNKALASIGVGNEIKEDKDFIEFSKNLNPELSIKDKYEMYLKFKPKKEVRKLPSMESGAASKVKDYYTAEEIALLTDKDLDNPEVWKAVRKSMTSKNYKNYYE